MAIPKPEIRGPKSAFDVLFRPSNGFRHLRHHLLVAFVRSSNPIRVISRENFEQDYDYERQKLGEIRTSGDGRNRTALVCL
jgi:hypothetical protein